MPEYVTQIPTSTMEDVEQANATGRTPVVFIHGLWLLPSSWDRWAEVFEEAGYAPLTPGWPDDPETVEEAKAHPEVFADKTVGQVADHFDDGDRRAGQEAGRDRALVRRAADPDHRRARACRRRSVAIDPAPFRGVLPLPISALKSASPVLGNPANRHRAVPLTYDQFRYAFANAVSEDEAKQLYETYAVPAAGAPLFQAATANLNPWTEAKVDTENPEPGPAADHLRREGPHGAAGDRERVVQEAEPQRGRHRDRRDARPRPRADHRQRLARGRRHRARPSSSASWSSRFPHRVAGRDA